MFYLYSDIGHLDFLEKVSKEGDYIIVGIHSDKVVLFIEISQINANQFLYFPLITF